MYKFGIRKATIGPPPAPIVTVTGATYTGATLSWSGSTGKYFIGGSTGNTFTDTTSYLILGSNITKTVAFVKLPQAGTYTVVVYASASANGSFGISAPVTIFIPYKPPTAPVIKTKTIGYNGVTLTWSASVSNTKQLSYRPYIPGAKTIENLNTSGLTSFVPLTAGATYNIGIQVTAPGPVYGTESTPTTVYIPFPAKPSVPVVTQSGATYSGVKLTWTAQTVVQAIKNSVTYDIIGSGVTYASGLTGLSSSVRIPAGTDNIEVVARAGLTFTESAPITVTIPLQKPTVPVLSQPVVGSTGGQISWTAATGNSPITYSVVSALGGTTYATGLTGTSTVIPFSRFTSYGSYPVQVVATAGTTYSVSAGATLRLTPAPPNYIMVNSLSPQGCRLSWAPDPISTKVSYSITELTGATFSVVQGPTFESASGLWLAGVSFGSAQVYDFFVSGSTAGFTGTTSEIVVYVPPSTSYIAPATSYLSKFYNPGTYTVTVPHGFSGFEAQLIGGGGGGGIYYGSGGGAGGFCLGTISAQAGATFALVVGAGGTGGQESYGVGRAGGTSSISTLRGRGGYGARGAGYGGTGGLAEGGTVNIAGGTGGAEIDINRNGVGAPGILILGQTYGNGGGWDNTSGIDKVDKGSTGGNGCALITFFP